MTTIFLATRQRTSRPLSDFSLVLGISFAGLIISLAVAIATWTDVVVGS